MSQKKTSLKTLRRSYFAPKLPTCSPRKHYLFWKLKRLLRRRKKRENDVLNNLNPRPFFFSTKPRIMTYPYFLLIHIITLVCLSVNITNLHLRERFRNSLKQTESQKKRSSKETTATSVLLARNEFLLCLSFL